MSVFATGSLSSPCEPPSKPKPDALATTLPTEATPSTERSRSMSLTKSGSLDSAITTSICGYVATTEPPARLTSVFADQLPKPYSLIEHDVTLCRSSSRERKRRHSSDAQHDKSHGQEWPQFLSLLVPLPDRRERLLHTGLYGRSRDLHSLKWGSSGFATFRVNLRRAAINVGLRGGHDPAGHVGRVARETRRPVAHRAALEPRQDNCACELVSQPARGTWRRTARPPRRPWCDRRMGSRAARSSSWPSFAAHRSPA